MDNILKTVEIEHAYKELLLYENEIKNFLLYVTGFHSSNEKRVWIAKSIHKCDELRDRRNSFMLGTLLFLANEDIYLFSDGRTYSFEFLYAEYLRIIRNSVNWLNAANIYLHE